MFRILVRNTLTLLVISISTLSFAHHGVNGQFDVSKETTVSGVVTEIRLVNPHAYVYFDVTNTEGLVEAWSCEMGGASILRRNGWTEEMFAPGTVITVTGNPSRTEEFGCVVQSVSLSDGRVVGTDDLLNAPVVKPEEVVTRLADGTPNLNGNWIALRQAPGRATNQRPTQGEGNRPPQGIGVGPNQTGGDRPALRGGGRGPQISQSEAGIAASAGFDRQDNPRFHCQTTNIFLDWTFNEQVNNIVQTEDAVTLNYGFMEMISRTIHLGMESHPANLVPSRTGHSIGKWEGDSLVVDTIGFAEGYLSATFNGVKHSESMHVVERFSLSEDGNTLNRSYVVDDPLYLSAPFEGSDSVVRTAYPFQEYGCEDLTQ